MQEKSKKIWGLVLTKGWTYQWDQSGKVHASYQRVYPINSQLINVCWSSQALLLQSPGSHGGVTRPLLWVAVNILADMTNCCHRLLEIQMCFQAIIRQNCRLPQKRNTSYVS